MHTLLLLPVWFTQHNIPFPFEWFFLSGCFYTFIHSSKYNNFSSIFFLLCSFHLLIFLLQYGLLVFAFIIMRCDQVLFINFYGFLLRLFSIYTYYVYDTVITSRHKKIYKAKKKFYDYFSFTVEVIIHEIKVNDTWNRKRRKTHLFLYEPFCNWFFVFHFLFHSEMPVILRTLTLK